MGLGHQRSNGVKSGTIVDMDDAERSARAAIAQAERMAGATLERVSLAVAAGGSDHRLYCAWRWWRGISFVTAIMARVMAGGEAYVERGGRVLVQLDAVGAGGSTAPRAFAIRAIWPARELSVELTAVTADEAPLRNLLQHR